MLTFVVNLHPNISTMALAEPFLYPLQKQGRLQLIFQNLSDLEQRIEGAAMEVRKRLEQSAYTQWRVIFLLSIDTYAQTPYTHSLSSQMKLIKDLFLDNEFLQQNPKEIFLIAVDQVNEDEAIPNIENKTYRDSWELDTKGFVRNEHEFFVSESGVKALDDIWQSKVHIGRDTIVNLGFDRLPEDIKANVNSAFADITNRVGQLLNINNIDFRRFAISRNHDYLNADTIKTIKKEFLQQLDNLKQDPTRYANFSPSLALKKSIARHVGIFSEENKYAFRLIRFPVKYTHEDILQRYLLKLAVLITMIADDEDIIKSLSKEDNYTVKIELNNQAMNRIMQNYVEQLHNMEVRFSNLLNNPLPSSVKMSDNTDCSCAETLNIRQPELLTMPFLRTNGDLPRWDGWE